MPSSIASGLVSLAAAGALAWTVIEERAAGRAPFLSLGRRWFGRGRTTVATLAIAAAAGLLLVVLPLAFETVPSGARPGDLMPGASAVTLALTLLFVIFEEISFRGALIDQLRDRIGGPQAVVASALLFGLAHAARPGDDSHAAVVAVTIVDGIGYGAAALATTSLWTSVAWHLTKNVAVWQLTGMSTLQTTAGVVQAGSPASTPETAIIEAGSAAIVVAIAVPLLVLLRRRS